ncbi:hypothetical protein [uncultured Parvibaculum sp.]|uniref:hypothetical protein n=1 Tax=uncultured Parvibaculum sp. TaxID=291828 RepID=UPI0030D74946|tara:strand:- start:55626 stop:55967 length:342 start_codon:yes stop_codon:yes gene_type:complete
MSRTFKTFVMAGVIGLSAAFLMSGAALAGSNVKHGQQTVPIDGRPAAPVAAKAPAGTVMMSHDRMTACCRVTHQRYGKSAPAMRRMMHGADAQESVPMSVHGSGQPANTYRKR